MANDTFSRSEGQPITRLKTAQLMADALPHNADLSYQAGVTLIQSQRAVEAPRYLRRAVAPIQKLNLYKLKTGLQPGMNNASESATN